MAKNNFVVEVTFKDLKNMWKGTKKIISTNNSNHIFPTAITVNSETITTANAFNNYFAKVAIDVQSSIRFSKKKYYDYLLPLNVESLFITPTDSNEVSNIISSLNQKKSDRPNSIPIKILKLLNKSYLTTSNPFQPIFFLWNVFFNFENQ